MDTKFLNKSLALFNAHALYDTEDNQYNERATEALEWCCEQYKKVNKKYDGMSYFHHIRMVASTAIRHFSDQTTPEKFYILLGCFGHDLIEDARVSYNDLNKRFGGRVADLIYSVTDNTGRTREERACYDKIVQTSFGPYLKMCDRYANGAYSKLTGSDMYEKYKSEYPKFRKHLMNNKDKGCTSLWTELDYLFEYKDVLLDIPLYS